MLLGAIEYKEDWDNEEEDKKIGNMRLWSLNGLPLR